MSLANDRERSAFAADIEAALTSRPEPILVDEWQEVPASLGHIKTLVDTDPSRGRFLITGSVHGDADAQTLRGFITMLVQTHVVHAHRRWEEMGLVAQTLRETGVDPLMTEAIERSHRRTVDAHIAPADGKVPSLDEALEILSEKVVRGV